MHIFGDNNTNNILYIISIYNIILTIYTVIINIYD